jgi:hypothetical protein
MAELDVLLVDMLIVVLLDVLIASPSLVCHPLSRHGLRSRDRSCVVTHVEATVCARLATACLTVASAPLGWAATVSASSTKSGPALTSVDAPAQNGPPRACPNTQ